MIEARQITNTPKQTLDCKGMQCPAPILHIARAARAAAGKPLLLEVVVDDADFPHDVAAWCRTSKNRVISVNEDAGVFVARLAINGAVEDELEQPASGSQQRTPLATPTALATPLATANTSEAPTRETLDCRGMQCPAPILGLAKLVKSFGTRPAYVEVTADDCDFPRDLEAWCRTTKHTLFGLQETAGVYRALLGINGAPAPTPDTPKAEPHGAASDAPPSVARRPPRRLLTRENNLGLIANGVAAVEQRLASSPAPANETMTEAPRALELWGLRAPEPIRRVVDALEANPGQRLQVASDDPQFMLDVVKWAGANSVQILSVQHGPEATHVELQGNPQTASAPQGSELTTPEVPLDLAPRENRCTILILKNDFESLMAAMLCATTATAQGMEAVMFFSFWGVNVLRGERPRKNVAKQRVSILQKMMQWMMPRGPSRQKMSKMHMGGMGLGMMQYFMRKNNVMTLGELIDSAVEQNVRFVVCSMSMGIMGIQKRDIMDLPNIEFAGVTTFVELSRRSSMSLVF